MKIKIDKEVSESKKQRSPAAQKRSEMLRMVMPLLSRENGEKLADAITSNNSEEVSSVMQKITQDLMTIIDKRKK